MWNSGSTPKTTSVGSMCTPTERLCSRLATRLPWLSIAACGDPAVPLVKMSTASASASTSVMGTGPASSSELNEAAPAMSFSVLTTVRSDGSAWWSTSDHADLAAASTTTATGSTTASSRWISGPGLVGFSGTATAPMPSTAR